LTSLSSIPIDSDNSGYSYGTVEVDFDENGIASLAMLNYPDAGSIRLTASAVIDSVTFNTADNGQPIDVYPSYLQLSVNETELLYASIGVQNNYKAGAPFTLSIGAYGVNNALLPNYQAENPQIKITRIQPVASLAKDGTVAYSNTGKISSGTSANFVTALSLRSDQNTDPIFSDGEYSYADAYYDEVGRIEIDIKDYNYLGNEITSDSSLVLGDFYPAYFDITVSDIPTLANTSGVFSYIGEPIGFATAPKFIITAYNALDEITENYSDTYWSYQPDEPSLEAHLSYVDSSTYTSTGTASEIDLGDTPIVTNNVNYDGAGIVTINNGEFQYNKIDTDNSIFDLVSPFDGSIDLVFASDFFTATFIGQTSNGQVSSNTICFKDNYASANCNSLSIKNVIGTELRYGRLTLPSTYGPETEPLVVPIRAEYYDTSQWLLNTDDNHTSIDFDKSANHLALLPSGSTDITGNIGNIFSTGKLLLGVANSSTDFLLNAPNTIGEVKLQLDPSNDPTGWSDYLNYDWNGDGFINAGDRPEATITFGLFRGNDRIIHWREVFD
ncbi:MAG: LamG domain-containing protein, partial [Paraglaciecola sp.]|nr:LamG domain-containing protein [Paraglaciecola sp.]